MILIQSCLPIVCTFERILIVNRTKDTILIGSSESNRIDSVVYYLNLSGIYNPQVEYNLPNIVINNKVKNVFIPQDSTCSFLRPSLFEGFKNNRIVFFVIKLDVAKNNSWEEICKKKLYDSLVVVPEMVEKKNVIEYKGKKL